MVKNRDRERYGFGPLRETERVEQAKEWPRVQHPLCVVPSAYRDSEVGINFEECRVEVQRRINRNTLKLGTVAKYERWDVHRRGSLGCALVVPEFKTVRSSQR